MFLAELAPEHPFVVSIFGAQYHTSQRNTHEQVFEGLLAQHPDHTDSIEEFRSGCSEPVSKIWLSYWKSASDYNAWWDSDDVRGFWESLLDNAGFWREIVTLSPSRVQSSTNVDKREGCGHLGDRSFNPALSGYWGCYQDRLKDPHNLSSSLQDVPRPESHDQERIQHGRVTVTNFPANMCFVVEGQDHSHVSGEEKELWFDRFDSLCRDWISDVSTVGPAKGILSARLCHDPNSGQLDDKHAIGPPFHFNRNIQLLYFTDLAAMEYMGRMSATHVKLRRLFLDAYGPGGEMTNGGLCTWVDTGIVGQAGLEAEYVGCYEGTGFMAYRDHPAFQSD